jgi:RNA polymerase sigma-70 factor (ECF subfamily)
MVAATTLIDSAEAAFERLFAQEYRRVASVAFRITRDADEAQDVAQEVFVRLARGKQPLDSERARSWLYQTAVHTALNALRSRRRRTAREAREFRLQQPLNAGSDPHELAERSAQATMLRNALMRLPHRDTEILALRYGGLSYREIADVMGVDAAQIGTRLARAERALKREIERETLG